MTEGWSSPQKALGLVPSNFPPLILKKKIIKSKIAISGDKDILRNPPKTAGITENSTGIKVITVHRTLSNKQNNNLI